MKTTTTFPLAAVRYTPQTPIESLLDQAVQALRARGVRLGGVVQHDVSGGTGPNHDAAAGSLSDSAYARRFKGVTRK